MWPGQSLRARLTIALLLVGLIPLAIFAPLVGTLVDQDAAGRETRERSAQASYVADHVAGRLDHVHRASAAVARHLAVLGPGPSRWQEALEKSGDLYPLRVRLVAFSADSQTLASSDGSLVPPDALPAIAGRPGKPPKLLGALLGLGDGHLGSPHLFADRAG